MHYAELHCRTNFSFLSGASHPKELVARAAELGLSALAITDLSGVYGIVRAWEARRKLAAAAEEEGGALTLPKLLFGSELELDPIPGEGKARQPSDALVVIARDREGYAQLSALISRGRRRVAKGEFSLAQAEVRRVGGAHLLVLAGGARSRLMRLLRHGEGEAARRELAALREAFGDALYLELTRHRRPGDFERSRALYALACELDVPVVASNDVFFHAPHRKKLADVLHCIGATNTLAEAGRRLLPNAERHLKDAAAMQALFCDLPQAVERSLEAASRCDFDLSQLHYSYPQEAAPAAESADEYLARLARQGLVDRLGPARARELRPRLEKELSIIAQLAYAGYFLTMWEVVRFCRKQRILCQGRGSAANSLVCYATGITSVSPDQIDMLFERFISLERHEPPDIDLDIEHDRREEVIQHVYEKYGREHAAMVCEVISYRHRSAIRDVGKVLGLSEQVLARVTRYLAGSGHGGGGDSPGERAPRKENNGPEGASAKAQATKHHSTIKDQAARAAGLDSRGRTWQQLLLLSELLVGFPRHLSIHVGGFLLSREKITELVPIENGRMADRTVIQWDKDDIEALGLFKVDLLGLGMLNVIARAFRLVEESRAIELDLASLPQGDAATYAMIQRADTLGVFQIESRAQMNMLPRLKPRDFYDLVIEVALVRPGPIQGGMVHPYLRRRRGEEPVEYAHPSLETILWRTLGVPIFQEQVMRVAVAVGGYSPGEADQLRRDMAAWRRSGSMERHQKRLYTAMRARGIAKEFAQRIIQQIEGFGSYGFPESHAAAFAHLVYISAYLKCHYAAEFAAALINAQPMGFYQVSSIVADAHRHGVAIHGVDVQESACDVQVQKGKGADRELRLGLRLVRELPLAHAERVIDERGRGGSFRSIADLARRCELPRKSLLALAAAGAFRSLSLSRREAAWQASALGGRDLVANLEVAQSSSPPLRELSAAERMRLDYLHAGSFIEDHPLQLYRDQLRRRGVLAAAELPQAKAGSRVRVAGLVIVRQRPGGGKMIFMALEDETGLTDVAVNLGTFERFRPLIMLAESLVVEGVLQLDGEARSVLANRFENLSGGAGGVRSRDFH